MTAVQDTSPGGEQAAGHRCEMPTDLPAGVPWTCPGCGNLYGQTALATPDVVNVGALLDDLADALVETGHGLAQGVPPREAQAAFYRLGGQVKRVARVFGNVGVAIPEQPGG